MANSGAPTISHSGVTTRLAAPQDRASGCTNRASYLFNQARREADATCALRSFERSYERNDAWGCTMVAVQLTRDREPDEDERRRALEALEKSCVDGEDSPACQAGADVRTSLRR